MANLSKYVTEQEFTTTQIRGVDNKLPEGVVRKNAIRLCNDFIDIVREFYKKPLIVNSGYRCPRVNELVGGSDKSQHKYGNAVDFYIIGVDLKQVFNDIASGKIKNKDGKPIMQFIDQLIIENLLKGTDVYSGSWIHLGISGNPRRQKMLAKFVNGKAQYTYVEKI